jgi:hypothetical protein
MSYTKDDSGNFICDCGEFTGSRSGYYKHNAVKHTLPKEDINNEVVNDDIEDSSTLEDVDDSTSWMDWGGDDVQDSATDFMPTPLKSLHKKSTAGKRSKRTKAELETARTTSKSITMLGLTFGDTALSVWGRGQLLDPEFKVQHDEKSKEFTADAVVGAMEERGLFLADSISRTAVATVMLGWYFGAPAYRIQKQSKKSLFRGGKGSGLLSKIPLIGRFFRKKNKPMTLEEVELVKNE